MGKFIYIKIKKARFKKKVMKLTWKQTCLNTCSLQTIIRNIRVPCSEIYDNKNYIMYLSYTTLNLIFHYKRDTVHENAGEKTMVFSWNHRLKIKKKMRKTST